MVSVPPYSGTPSLSHQLPVAAVVVVVVTWVVGVVVVTVCVTVVVVLVVCVVCVVCVVDVDVDLEQEASTNDVTRTQLSTIQKTRFFI
jgi:hypothetical protein